MKIPKAPKAPKVPILVPRDVFQQAMGGEDVNNFEEVLRRWVHAAGHLSANLLIDDSNTIVKEILRSVSEWDHTMPPLPSLFYCLSDIFNQIPAPPHAILWPDYFKTVINAHDLGEPIPDIPTERYPAPRHLAKRLYHPPSATAQGKRKAIAPPSPKDGSDSDETPSKKRRVDTPAESEGEGHVSDDDEDELDDEEDDPERIVKEEPVSPSTSLGRSSVGPQSSQLWTPPSTRPIVEIPTKKKKRAKASAAYIHSDADSEATSNVPAATPNVPESSQDLITPWPKIGMTEAELRASRWQDVCAKIGIKGVQKKLPVLFDSPCGQCVTRQDLCWTMEKMSACVHCRQTKQSCSNSVNNGGVLMENVEKVVLKPKAPKGKKAAASKPQAAKPVTKTPATKATKAPPAPKASSPPAREASSPPPPASSPPPPAKKAPPPPAVKAPAKASSKVPAATKLTKASQSRGNATNSRPSSAPGPSDQLSTAVAQTAPVDTATQPKSSRSRASSRGSRTGPVLEATDTETAGTTDKLVALPAQPNELRYQAPFTFQPAATSSLSRPSSDLAGRLEVAEAEIRRLSDMVNQQLQTVPREVFQVMNHVNVIYERFCSFQTSVRELSAKVERIESRMNNLERASAVGSVLSASNPSTPHSTIWPPYYNSIQATASGIMGSEPASQPVVSHDDSMVVDDALASMAAASTSTQPTNVENSTEPSASEPTSAVDQAMHTGTVHPSATLIAPPPVQAPDLTSPGTLCGR